MQKKVIALVGVVVVLVVAGVAAWAVASRDGGESTARGTCDAVTYELGVEKDDGGHEVSFELQSASPGEIWQVDLTQGDRSLFSGQRTTDEDAEIDVDVLVHDLGAGSIDATFTPDGGAECTATLRR